MLYIFSPFPRKLPASRAAHAACRYLTLFVSDRILWKQGQAKICSQQPEYKFDIVVVHKRGKTFEMEQSCSNKTRRYLEIELNDMRRNLKSLDRAENARLDGIYPVVFSEDVLMEGKP
jgi:hypothetical protein